MRLLLPTCPAEEEMSEIHQRDWEVGSGGGTVHRSAMHKQLQGSQPVRTLRVHDLD